MLSGEESFFRQVRGRQHDKIRNYPSVRKLKYWIKMSAYEVYSLYVFLRHLYFGLQVSRKSVRNLDYQFSMSAYDFLMSAYDMYRRVQVASTS